MKQSGNKIRSDRDISVEFEKTETGLSVELSTDQKRLLSVLTDSDVEELAYFLFVKYKPDNVPSIMADIRAYKKLQIEQKRKEKLLEAGLDRIETLRLVVQDLTSLLRVCADKLPKLNKQILKEIQLAENEIN